MSNRSQTKPSREHSVKTKTKTKQNRKNKMSEKPKNVTIVREGNQIIIPDKMTYSDARDWLTKQEQAEEQLVKIHDNVSCFPQDGLIALMRAMQEIYGFVDIKGWFGSPPYMVQVQTPNGIESAPFGRISAPTWEGGYLETTVAGPAIVVGGVVKRKFESKVKSVLALMRTKLRDNSIYKGQAFHVDLHWWDDHDRFNVDNDAPKYMETSDEPMVLNETTEFELTTSVFMILEQSKLCQDNGIALKHGALFKGPFGTGKTMTAKTIAHKARANGWTFIYLKFAHQLANGLRLAKMYAPAVLFCEDVDTVVRERDGHMNDLLNVLDGVDTKTSPIMVILTTNNAETIDPSFLRPGRIDTVIHFGEPDASTAIKFVEKFSGSLLKPGEDLTAVGVALKGIVPASIRDCISKAKRYAMYREGSSNIEGCMVANDLLKAARAVREHMKMMEAKKPTAEQVVAHAARTLHVYGETEEILEPLITNGGRH